MVPASAIRRAVLAVSAAALLAIPLGVQSQSPPPFIYGGVPEGEPGFTFERGDIAAAVGAGEYFIYQNDGTPKGTVVLPGKIVSPAQVLDASGADASIDGGATFSAADETAAVNSPQTDLTLANPANLADGSVFNDPATGRLYIGRTEPFQALEFEFGTPNAAVANLTVRYSSVTSLSGWTDLLIADGTASSGATLGQDGRVSWTLSLALAEDWDGGRVINGSSPMFWVELSVDGALTGPGGTAVTVNRIRPVMTPPFTAGCAFDWTTAARTDAAPGSRDLYTTNFDNGKVYRFRALNPDGTPDLRHRLTGVYETFVAGSINPESVDFAANGDLFVGNAGPPPDAQPPRPKLLKFPRSGGAPIVFDPITEFLGFLNDPTPGPYGEEFYSPEGRYFEAGVDWIDVGGDQETVYFTSESPFVYEYDTTPASGAAHGGAKSVAASVGAQSFALRLLPPGDGSDLLVAARAEIRRFKKIGGVMQQVMVYDSVPGDLINDWFSVNLDPDGKHFWAASQSAGSIHKWEIASGNHVMSFETGVALQPPYWDGFARSLNGLCLVDELTAGQENCFNGMDDDGDGLTDLSDPSCQPIEVCGNDTNDDGDQYVADSTDPDCVGALVESCNDSVDNDGDTIINEGCQRLNFEGDANSPTWHIVDETDPRSGALSHQVRVLENGVEPGVILFDECTALVGGEFHGVHYNCATGSLTGQLDYQSAGDHVIEITTAFVTVGQPLTQTIPWHIGNVPLPPPAVDDFVTIDEDPPGGVVTIDVLANDRAQNPEGPGEPLTVIAVTQPPAGTGSTAVGSGGQNVTYSPPANFHGVATFTYTVQDADGFTATGNVTVTVNSVNDPPVAVDDAVTMLEDSAPSGLAIDVLANDNAANPDAPETLTIIAVTQPAPGKGSAAIGGDGTYVIYTAPADFNGQAEFNYVVQDPDGLTDTAKVTVTVTPVNDAPSFIKGPDQTVNEDAGPQTVTPWATNVSAGAPDESGQTLTFQIISNTNSALFSAGPALSSDGTLTYTPAANANGMADITINLKDNGGAANGGSDTSPSQTFRITVNVVNDAPSFTKGPDQTVNEDAGPQTVTPWATNISAGPANESGQTVTFQVVGNTNPGLFSAGPAVASDGTLTYTPAANANGVADITINLKDNGGTASGGSDTSPPQTFRITVNAVNDAPSYTPGPNVTVAEDSGPYAAQWATNISAGPPDEGSQVLTFQVTNNNNALFSQQPAISPTGELTFTPAPNQSGTATVTVVLKDNGGTANGGVDSSPPSTFTITVTAINDPPVAVDDTAKTNRNQTVLIPVLQNDIDVDGPFPLTVASVTQPANGTATIQANGRVRYRPNPSFVGVDTFEYTVRDGAGGTDDGRVTVTVLLPPGLRR